LAIGHEHLAIEADLQIIDGDVELLSMVTVGIDRHPGLDDAGSDESVQSPVHCRARDIGPLRNLTGTQRVFAERRKDPPRVLVTEEGKELVVIGIQDRVGTLLW
jgi:hypothetical protein